MKKILLSLTVVALSALTMYGQGRVAWNNYIAAPNPVTVAVDNQGPSGGNAGDFVGANYSVQLLWAPGVIASQAAFDAANPSSSPIVNFFGVTGTGPAHGPTVDGAGLYEGNVVAMGGPAGTYTMQVRAWYNGGTFATYAAALGNANSGLSLLTQVGVTESPNLAPNLTIPGFTVGLSVIPEPSMFALAGLGLAGLLIFRRRK